MRLTGITGRGLTGMAVAVGLLWSCLIGERLIVRHANRVQSRALRDIDRLRGHSEPVVSPVLRPLSRPRAPLG